jgi:hypothetical protein
VRRYLATILVLAAALPGLVVASAPAGAANGTSSVGCSTGDSCTVMLQKMVSFTGLNYDRNGGGNTVVDITPPPCLWEPIGGAQQGSQSIIDQYGTNPPDLFEIPASVTLAKKLVKTQTPGEWYELPANPNDDAAQLQACAAQPLFAWVLPDNAPPGLVIPPQTLAQLAVGVMRLPDAGQLILDPARTTYTNLPTFLAVTLGRQHYTGPGRMPYARVTATLAGNAATVWAVPSKLQVSAAGGGQYTADTSNCGYLGSAEMGTAAAQNAGPGTPIDCGLTFQSPATWQVTATMTWRACWAPVVSDGPPPAGCQPVPGAQLNNVTWGPRPVVVNEIQSVDNGNG